MKKQTLIFGTKQLQFLGAIRYGLLQVVLSAVFAIHLERQSLNAGTARQVAPSAHSERGIINERAAGARKNRKSSVRMPLGGRKGDFHPVSNTPLPFYPSFFPSHRLPPTSLPCMLFLFSLTPSPLYLNSLFSSLSPTLFTLSPFLTYYPSPFLSLL